MPTTVTSKGQVTISEPVRDALGVGPGQAVEFTLQPDGKLLIAKAGGDTMPGRPVRAFARHHRPIRRQDCSSDSFAQTPKASR